MALSGFTNPLPVNQGDLSDQFDSVAVRGMYAALNNLTATSVTDLVPPTQVDNYATVVVRLSGTWVGFVQFSFGPDGTNWSAYQTVGTNGTFVLPRLNSYFKASVTTYTSGTIEGSFRGFANPLNLAPGNNAFPVPPFSMFMGMQDNAGNLGGMRTASAVGDAGSGNFLAAFEPFYFNGTNHDRARTPNVFKTAQLTASGAGAVWTPAGGRRFRLMGYSIEVTSDAAIASAGRVTLDFKDAAASIGITHELYVPNTAGTTMNGGYRTGNVLLGNGRLSSAVNNVLNLDLSATLTSGAVRVNVYGTEE